MISGGSISRSSQHLPRADLTKCCLKFIILKKIISDHPLKIINPDYNPESEEKTG